MRNWLPRSPWRRSACAILLSLFATPVLAAPAPVQPATAPADKERSGRLAEMKEIAEKIAVYEVDSTNRVPTERVNEAVLRMTDPSRERLDGTVWLWCADGRPVAILQLWAQSDRPGMWFLSPSSLSTGLVAADGEGGWRWSPQRPGVKFEPLPSEPAPAETALARLRQMKEFARRFAAHEFWDPNNQRTELRLLGQPIYRYVKPKGVVFDGAVFAFCHDTDPEVILLIEAIRQGPDTKAWRFGAGPLGSAELHLELDRRDVWQMPRAPGVVGGPTEPYWLFHVPMRNPQ